VTGDTPDAGRMRRDYTAETGLVEADLAPDWVTQFGRWFADAAAAGIAEPNAMVVATATADGRPSARTVLLKAYGADGLVFFTNYQSRKGAEALANPYASLVFPWLALHRQVVACGRVEPVTRAETEAYFATRPRGAQLGAWASPQSRVIPDRAALERAYADHDRRYAADAPVPAPPDWGGFRVVPDTVEFWQGRADRLHDRLRYRWEPAGEPGGEWVVERLAP
jgi:pyridoxamine 5'-phosphate oxidase